MRSKQRSAHGDVVLRRDAQEAFVAVADTEPLRVVSPVNAVCAADAALVGVVLGGAHGWIVDDRVVCAFTALLGVEAAGRKVVRCGDWRGRWRVLSEPDGSQRELFLAKSWWREHTTCWPSAPAESADCSCCEQPGSLCMPVSVEPRLT